MGNLPDFLVRQALVAPILSLFEHTQHPGLGLFPVDAPIPVRVARSKKSCEVTLFFPAFYLTSQRLEQSFTMWRFGPNDLGVDKAKQL